MSKGLKRIGVGLGSSMVMLFPVSQAAASEAQAVATTVADVVVIGQRVNLQHIPGSGTTIEAEDLERARVLTVNEALRQVPGLYPRDEEGLGLRPNIGVRGLSPTRSSEVLLLEDGLPLTYAVYGDNATYSHPPLGRFERIEVLKGASQIQFGPHTVGGVVNYISPRAPGVPRGMAQVAVGANDYQDYAVSLGGPVAGFRALARVGYTHFDGIRENHDFSIQDYSLRVERTFASGHEVIGRFALSRENSQVSYSGLTQAEFQADPYANPFPNDRFDTRRLSAALTHGWEITPGLRLTTSAYWLNFERDWWRQSSNSGQRPNDASDPLCGGMANLNTTCGTEGRLRAYDQYGVESRVVWRGRLRSIDADLQGGVRWHAERQDRLQVNADTPTGRTPGTSVNGGVVENNLREARAWSGFVLASLDFGRLTVSPGVRLESIDYDRTNRLNGARGATGVDELIPGIGFTLDLTERLVLYGGVHRGFSPPRVEDVVTNAGGTVDLDAERSINWEAGLRGPLRPGLEIDITAFVMDFENQIVPASVAGGVGATLTSAGATRHSGLEVGLRASSRSMGLTAGDDIYLRTAATWVAEAEFTGVRFSNIAGFGAVPVRGNRLPYAPEWISSLALGYARGDWLTVQAEVQHTGAMFTDDLNTVDPTANGQRGRIASSTTLNLALNVRPGGGPATVFLTVKNVTDDLSIVDRSRGILPSAPRLWQAGASLDF